MRGNQVYTEYVRERKEKGSRGKRLAQNLGEDVLTQRRNLCTSVCCVKEGGGGEMPLTTKMLCREYELE